jgi:FixJ family two-component response regulator
MSDTLENVLLVDDDASLRRSLTRTLRHAGYTVQAFSTAAEFLAHPVLPRPCCVLLDVQLPDLDGLALQERVRQAGCTAPVVFITGHGDIPMSVRAMKAGAADFLPKPFGRDELLAAVKAALLLDRGGSRTEEELGERRARYRSLSPREKEVFRCVAAGLMNKHIAAELGISEKTVKFHRANMAAKLGSGSVADLTRIAVSLDLGPGCAPAR